MQCQHQRRQQSHNERSALLKQQQPQQCTSPQMPLKPARKTTRRTLRQDIWTVLRFRSSIPHRSGLQMASYVLEFCVLVLILLNVVLAISESSTAADPNEPAPRYEWYSMFLFTSTIIFSVEYVLRLWSCVEDERYHGAILGRLKWMVRPLSLLDLIALIPFYLEICFEFMLIPSYAGALILRSLRLLRIISFLRLERSYNAMKQLRVIFARKKEELLVVSYFTTVVVLTSSTTIYFLENSTQPEVFSSIGVCAWWSIETITSLGYGDIVPKSTAGRFFGSILAVSGIVLFAIPGAVLGSGFIEVMLEKQRHDEEDEYTRAVSMQEEPQRTSSPPPSFSSSTKHFFPEYDDEDGALRIALPVTPPPSSSSRSSLRRLSPRITTALKLEQVYHKLDAMAGTQQQLQEQLRAQQTQLNGMSALLEALVAASSVSKKKEPSVDDKRPHAAA